MKDTYNYVTVQTDIRMPRRQFDVLTDTVRQSAWQVKRPADKLNFAICALAKCESQQRRTFGACCEGRLADAIAVLCRLPYELR